MFQRSHGVSNGSVEQSGESERNFRTQSFASVLAPGVVRHSEEDSGARTVPRARGGSLEKVEVRTGSETVRVSLSRGSSCIQHRRSTRSKSQVNSSNHDLASVSKRSASLSSSQKNLNLTAAQRLDFLIQGTPTESTIEGNHHIAHTVHERLCTSSPQYAPEDP